MTAEKEEITVGTIILHGGGTTAPETTKALIARAGGADAPLLVFGQTSETPLERGKRSAAWISENGAKKVSVAQTTAAGDGTLPALLALLKGVRGAWIPGGDQNRFQKIFDGAQVAVALREMLAKGGVVGGSSAGASLMGEWMPTGEGDRTKIAQGSVQTAPGLGLLSGVVVDSHLLARERTQRLLSMTLSRAGCVGVGVDEDGWAEVELPARRLTVRGGQVLVLRPVARITRGRENRLGSRDTRLEVLLPGDSVVLPSPRRA